MPKAPVLPEPSSFLRPASRGGADSLSVMAVRIKSPISGGFTSRPAHRDEATWLVALALLGATLALLLRLSGLW